MTLVRGEWYNQGKRPVLKEMEDLEQGDFAACAITCETLADGHVVTAKLAACNVTNVKASLNLRYRTYTAFIDKQSVSSSDGWSTAYVVWQPSIAVNLLDVKHYTLGVYENATCDNLALFKNASSSFGQVALKTLTTDIAGGTMTDFSLAACVALAACTPVAIKLTGSTCSVPSRQMLVFGYESSG